MELDALGGQLAVADAHDDATAAGRDLEAVGYVLVDDDSVPDAFEVSARGGGVVMAMRHRELPAEGVQFHPESVLTPDGKRLLENFLA